MQAGCGAKISIFKKAGGPSFFAAGVLERPRLEHSVRGYHQRAPDRAREFSSDDPRIHPKTVAMHDTATLEPRIQKTLQLGRKPQRSRPQNLPQQKLHIARSTVGLNKFVFQSGRQALESERAGLASQGPNQRRYSTPVV